MGACCMKEEDVRPLYKYRNLTTDELYPYLRDGPTTCILCHTQIPHVYMTIAQCYQCKKIIGHDKCLSLWRERHNYCPNCKK
jgi:hypothetical protein